MGDGQKQKKHYHKPNYQQRAQVHQPEVQSPHQKEGIKSFNQQLQSSIQTTSSYQPRMQAEYQHPRQTSMQISTPTYNAVNQQQQAYMQYGQQYIQQASP